jgi:2-amino-4-hydroxy-6-hydroxymethyldihydropteridine diphosphokinase
MTRAFVGMGSNRGDQKAFLERARARIAAIPQTAVRRVSSLYATEAWGEPGQPEFLNAVLLLETELGPERLLSELQGVESALGRPRSARRGPRTIDLDLLYYGKELISGPGIEVPHPRIPERPFVLVPLAEIDPIWVDPRLGVTVETLLRGRRGLDAVRWAGRFSPSDPCAVNNTSSSKG